MSDATSDTQNQPVRFAKVSIEPATLHDVPVICGLIQELAEFERLQDEFVATEARLLESLFGAHPYAEVLMARLNGESVGFALFFHNYSTFLAQPGIWLEDLFVRPAYRGGGIGKSMLAHLARLAVERDCGRVEWAVLDWNAPSIGFYESLGARSLSEWTTFRLTGDALTALARSSE